MLVMFRVKNFASFKDEVILDMRAVSYKDMKNHVIEKNNNKVIKTLAVYGKNASGKSNLVSAIYYFESFVYNQFFDAKNREDDIDIDSKMPNVKCNTFKLSDIKDNDSEFEIIYVFDNHTYQYGFSIRDILNTNRYEVIDEWLQVDDKSVFERKKGNINFGKKYESVLKNIDKYREDRLYIGVLDYFATGEVKEIIDSFKLYFKEKLNVYFELFLEGSVKGFVSRVGFSNRLLRDDKYRKLVEKFIKVADIGITKLSVEKSTDKRKPSVDRFDIKTVHNVYDEKGNIVREEKFDLDMESSGTLRYLSFIQHILNRIEEGGVFVVDELSARLHPMLTKFIVDLFQSDVNKEAQLIFTTHDISLMNRKQFRRDEIAFVEKNEKGISKIYTLADIKARSDASFSKDYMAGKYGAIPVFPDEVYKETVGEWLCQD